MLHLYKKSVLFLLLMLTALASEATHLVGGSMWYRYLRTESNGNLVYLLQVDVYRDCSGANAELDETIVVGVYHNDAAKNLYTKFQIGLAKPAPDVSPVNSTQCPNSIPACIQYGKYSREIELPPSTVGYWITFERCCRNTQTNLPDNPQGTPYMGQTYNVFIPKTVIRNSSPRFAFVPVPYICANDPTNILNTAVDPDGDSLVYSFTTPINGGNAGPGGAMPDPPPNLNLPLPTVIYNPGYSGSFPFGATGTTAISSDNGLTTLMAPSPGRYAIAIEVKEYRNGVYISSIFLDLQIIVINCPPNNKPNVGAASFPSYREVEAGNTLCFDIVATDADAGDSVYLSGVGDIFTGANGFKGPTATLNEASGIAKAKSQFCWTPSCEQGRDMPYVFAVQLRDNGCLPKYNNTNFTVKVLKFIGANTIIGKDSVCENELASYRANGQATSTYKWAVENGVIVSGQGTSTISVQWGAPPTGSGMVSVMEISNKGCKGDSILKPIGIKPIPGPPVLSGDTLVCSFSTGKTYSVTVPNSKFNYSWQVTGGTLTGFGSGSATVNWGAAGKGFVKVFATNTAGCSSDTTTLEVNIIDAVVDSLNGTPSVCPNNDGIEYWVKPHPGATYVWTIVGGTQASGGNTDRITVNWGDKGQGYVKVFEINRIGCISDTAILPVTIDHQLEGMDPIGPMDICEFTPNVRYEVMNTNGSVYTWTITGGTLVSGQSTNSILVDWGAAGTGRVSVRETSFDPVNNLPCIGRVHFINVAIHPNPVPNPIEGNMEICQHTGSYTYHTNGFAGSTYTWRINGDDSNINGQGTGTISKVWDQAGIFNVSVLEITQFGCIGTTIDTQVIVHPKPTTSAIQGLDKVCYPDLDHIQYSVQGFANSTYAWTIDGGTAAFPSTADSITVNWAEQLNSEISVVETSEFGCLGDPVRLPVIVDHPEIDMKVISVGDPDNYMDIYWRLINAPVYNGTFTIQRRKANSGNSWYNVATVPGTDSFYRDKGLNTDMNAFEYRILGQNVCGNPLYSELHTNVLITGKKPKPYSVSLNFTDYLGWDHGVESYDLYRRVAGKGYELYESNVAPDQVLRFDNGFDGYTQCYRIQAHELDGLEENSFSNEICFDFDPVIWVPNAFTPNDDGTNELFIVKGGALKTYEINIYNRWGEKIYVSRNLEDSWDGIYRGVECPQGVYVYVINITGFDNSVKVLTGNITLLR